MFDITAIGEALIDLTQTGLSASGVAEYAANPGGAPANLAVAAAKLGASTAFIGRVGADAFGTQLRECLRANGVDVSRMLTDAQRPTTLAVVSLDSRGERSFSFYRQHSADLALSPDDVPNEALRRTHFFHFGGVSLPFCKVICLELVKGVRRLFIHFLKLRELTALLGLVGHRKICLSAMFSA